MAPDGSGRVQLTANRAFDGDPAWSPDGARIAFVSSRDSPDASGRDVYVMNADGSAVTHLTDSPAADSSPRWSPDGTRIAFVSDRDGNPEIYAMGADGSSQSRLTENPGQDSDPVWSPAGSQIAFLAGPVAQPADLRVHVMNVDGSDRHLVGDRVVFGLPSWSPDGRHLLQGVLYDPTTGAGVGQHGSGGEFIVVDADGANERRLTDNRASEEEPVWSPDGTRIAFVSDLGNDQFQTDVYVMGADGSAPQRLTTDAAPDYSPVWFPDGDRIAFVRRSGGYDVDLLDIYTIGVDGSGERRLTTGPGPYRFITWSPDRRHVLFASAEPQR